MNSRNTNNRASRSGNNRDDSQIQRIIVDINNVESIVNDIKQQLTTAKTNDSELKQRIEFLENVILRLTGISIN